MKRRSYGRDAGLSLRMLLTGSMLGLLYVVFAVVLFQVLSVGLVPMLVIVLGLAIFQYYTSDKLALAASGAKVVERDQAPELHAMVERLCAMADLPKPREQFRPGLADRAAGFRRDVLPQPAPDPGDLPLSRVRRRPRLRSDHRRPPAPDERAAEDREPHVPDPAA